MRGRCRTKRGSRAAGHLPAFLRCLAGAEACKLPCLVAALTMVRAQGPACFDAGRAPLAGGQDKAQWRGLMAARYTEAALREVAGLDVQALPPRHAMAP